MGNKESAPIPLGTYGEAGIGEQDLIVIPENRVIYLDNIFPGVPKVVLVQGSYIFLSQHGLDERSQALDHPDIKAWWCVSDLIEETLRALEVRQPIHRIPNYIDSSLFHYAPNKKPQIAYMPRRLKDDAQALSNLLQLRGRLNGFSFVPIDNATPEEVARILKESLIFLSFSHREGFGLPPAEAMACGCIVIGYTGNAGEEFMTEGLCYPVREGNLLDFASKVELVIESFRKDSELYSTMMRRSEESIRARYNLNSTSKALQSAMESLSKYS